MGSWKRGAAATGHGGRQDGRPRDRTQGEPNVGGGSGRPHMGIRAVLDLLPVASQRISKPASFRSRLKYVYQLFKARSRVGDRHELVHDLGVGEADLRHVLHLRRIDAHEEAIPLRA